MATGDVEVLHSDGSWHVKVEGESGVVSTHDTKDEAVGVGRDVAKDRGVELVIKNLNGQIAEKDSEGHDPRNVPG